MSNQKTYPGDMADAQAELLLSLVPPAKPCNLKTDPNHRFRILSLPLTILIGVATGSLFAAQPAKASLDCFGFDEMLTCVGINATNGSAQFTWKRAGSSTWGSWGTMGGRLSSTTSCAPKAGGFDCFGRGDSGNLFLKSFQRPSGPAAFTPSGSLWTDLGAPLISSDGVTRGQIQNDPSCVRLGELVTCFMNTNDGNFSQFSQVGDIRSWRWLGRPRLDSSPSCFSRTIPTSAARQIVCVGENSTHIVYRTFFSNGEASSDWTTISKESLGLFPYTSGREVDTRCKPSRSGSFACLTTDSGYSLSGARSHRPLILFEGAELITGRRQDSPLPLERPEIKNLQECIFTGSNTLSCLDTEGTGYTLRPDSTWTTGVALDGAVNVRRCVSFADGSQAERIGANFSRRHTRTREYLSSPMSNVLFSMGTWTLFGPTVVPEISAFPLCNPANYSFLPTRFECEPMPRRRR